MARQKTSGRSEAGASLLILKGFWDKGAAIRYFLGGKQFSYSVDLGSGAGQLGPLLKSHTQHLVGVDYVPQPFILQNGYDEFVQSFIQDYAFPPQCDSVFMLDSIEHMTEEDGFKVLERIGTYRYIMITTPSQMRPSNPMFNPHISVWTRPKLEAHGFQVHNYMYLIFLRDLIAFREP